MEAIEALTRYADMTPGKRCPDFDEDCAGVKDHAHCAAGSVVVWYGSLEVLPPIDGFCPYVCGMMGSNAELRGGPAASSPERPA
jgi:hypothetical protein